MESSGAEHSVQNVERGNLDRAVLKRTPEGRSRLRAEVFTATGANSEIAPSRGNPVRLESAEESELGSSEEDSGGTQPYPYMDLDLESARTTQERRESAGTITALRVKEEAVDDSLDISGLSLDVANEESLYNAKENPFAGGYRRDRNQMTSSPFDSGPPSLESPQTVTTSSLRRFKKKVGKCEG